MPPLTGSEQLFRAFDRWARAFEPDVRRQLMSAWQVLAAAIGPAALSDLLASGAGADRIVADLLDDEVLAQAFGPVTAVAATEALRSAGRWRILLPSAAAKKAGPVDPLNPRVLDGLRALDTRVARGLAESVRETVWGIVDRGIREGVHPRTMARQMREFLPLAPNQAEAVSNFERMLREGDREALTRQLRDRRFDGTLRKALGRDGTGLGEDRVRRMTEAYRRRMIAHNAETHARTIANDTHRAAQRLCWEDAIGKGLVERGETWKVWETAKDDRVRNLHVGMQDKAVPFDEPWEETGEMVPGESTYNCRCLARYVIRSKGAV